jgi:lipopolysaccharide transport protein LptA
MAPLRVSRLAVAVFAGSFALAGSAAAGAAAAPAAPAAPTAPGKFGPRLADDQPIKLDAGSSDMDVKSNQLVFHSIRIAQGGLAVEADEATATGLDFKDSHWLFRGNVRITVPDGFLVSDEARVAFAANAIATADATGNPAAFEQKRERGVARGHSRRIEYDFGADTVRLLEDAWLSYDDNEITGRTLLYNLRTQSVRANAEDQDSQRVRITINPRKAEPKPNP